jgi:hypothetical protein
MYVFNKELGWLPTEYVRQPRDVIEAFTVILSTISEKIQIENRRAESKRKKK